MLVGTRKLEPLFFAQWTMGNLSCRTHIKIGQNWIVRILWRQVLRNTIKHYVLCFGEYPQKDYCILQRLDFCIHHSKFPAWKRVLCIGWVKREWMKTRCRFSEEGWWKGPPWSAAISNFQNSNLSYNMSMSDGMRRHNMHHQHGHHCGAWSLNHGVVEKPETEGVGGVFTTWMSRRWRRWLMADGVRKRGGR